MSSPETYHAEVPSQDKSDDVEEDVEHEKREDAFVHLMASGRVENREAAESYLDTLNQIKVKLLQFARDQVARESRLPQDTSLDRGYSFPAVVSKNGLDKITADGLDRNNPELWKLERSIKSSYTDYLPEEQAHLDVNGVGLKDRLEINFADSPSVYIYPDSGNYGRNTFKRLRDYLSDEDFAFIATEYGFTAKDLARKLRAVADRVAGHTAPADSWERFSSEDRK
jgi:hypothetical protein